MYFPYLRGRQFELIGLRELLDSKKIGDKIIPIIEPIKPTAALLKTINVYLAAPHLMSMVFNPAVGDFVSKFKSLEKEDRIASGITEAVKTESLIKAYIFKKDAAKYLSPRKDKSNLLIVCNNRDMADEYLEVFGDEMPRYTLIPPNRVLQRLVENTGVLFEDNFKKCSRNTEVTPKS